MTMPRRAPCRPLLCRKLAHWPGTARTPRHGAAGPLRLAPEPTGQARAARGRPAARAAPVGGFRQLIRSRVSGAERSTRRWPRRPTSTPWPTGSPGGGRAASRTALASASRSSRFRRHGVDREADDFPAARRGQPVSVRRAQVIAVRLHVRGEWPEHGRGVAVHVRERVDRGMLARRAGSSGARSLEHPGGGTGPGRGVPRRPVGRGSHATLTTADRTYPRAVTPPPGAHCAIVSRAAVPRRPGRARAAVPAAAAGGPRRLRRYARQLCGPVTGTARHAVRRSGGGTGMAAGCAACWPRPGVPLHRSRSERFDELILEAVARLESRWESPAVRRGVRGGGDPPRGAARDDARDRCRCPGLTRARRGTMRGSGPAAPHRGLPPPAGGPRGQRGRTGRDHLPRRGRGVRPAARHRSRADRPGLRSGRLTAAARGPRVPVRGWW